MRNVIIITGASRGLGKAMVDLAVKQQDTIVVSLSRSIHEDHQELGNRFVFSKTDLSGPFQPQSLEFLDTHIAPGNRIFFFNNAGNVLPIGAIGEFNADDIQSHVQVNVAYPAALVNYLIGKYKSNSKVFVNISSGAANRPIEHWGLYCASKAFMKMYFNVLEEEHKNVADANFHNIEPGVLDTGMRENIRNSTFPDQSYFVKLQEENKLYQC